MKLYFFSIVLFVLPVIVFAQQWVSLDSIIHQYQEKEFYDKDKYPLGKPELSYYEEKAAFADRLLFQLQNIQTDSLNRSDRISAELLRFQLQDEIDRYTYKIHLNPIQADQGFHLDWNYLIRPITTKKQADEYLKKLKAIPYITTSKITLMRKGIEEGVVQPKAIFNGYETGYEMHIVNRVEDSEFYQPLKELPQDISVEVQDSLQQVALSVIQDSVITSFQRIKKFFEEEYLPQAPKNIGVNNRPNGKEFYQNRMNYYTTATDYTPEEIHALGVSEVARIRAEMEKVIEETGFSGNFDDFVTFLRSDEQFYASTADELLMIARDISKRMDAQLPVYFRHLPRQPYGVIPVPAALAPKYTAGRYSGNSIHGKEPGYYLVNTYKLDSRPLYALPALTAHEAVPGHHLQGALNQELSDSIPEFRRNLYLSAYGEGWGLYSEYLADEMGIYRTPYEKFGQLTYEMWRACRLVVDTGIHAFGWTREEVIEYMKANTALSIHEINTETDRYIGWPGQALSYKIGELKIRELRTKAEAALGESFDIRSFHEVILGQGTVTLPILEELVNQWIATERETENQ